MRLDSVMRRNPLRRTSFRVAAALLLALAGAATLHAQPNQPIRLLSPTAGQNLVVDSTARIIWTTTSAVTGTLVVEYSTDSAATWTQIDTAAPLGRADTLLWTVPNATTTNGYVRVRETGSARSGRSGRFSIVSLPVPLIQVIYPNGGMNQAFIFDSTVNIRWYSEYVSGQVKVQYSIDSGATWMGIDTVTAQTGNDTLAWTVPQSATTRALVRVATLNDSTSDRSNNTFTLRAPDTTPSIQVVSPNGGNVFIWDNAVSIRWSAANITGQLKVQYSVDSGATWRGIDTVAARSGTDTLLWTVPHDSTARAFVRVATLNDSTSDRSNRVFSIFPPDTTPSLRVLNPNGGNVYGWDSTVAIRWTGSNVTGQIKVEYSIDSGATWKGIDTVPARAGNDTLVWVTPHETTERALVRVSTLDNATSDISNALFSIKQSVAPRIHVLYANGGETLTVGEVAVLSWEAEDVSGMLLFQLSRDNGATWSNIGFKTAMTGVDTLNWTVTGPATTTALFRVSTAQGGVRDTSDATFAIVDPPPGVIHLLYPNGGETFRADTMVTVLWTDSNMTGSIFVAYSTNGGTNWTVFDTVAAANGVNSTVWTVPNVGTADAMITVVGPGGEPFDQTDGPFTIVARAAGVEEGGVLAAATVAPNPTRGSVSLGWTQKRGGEVVLKLYDLRGVPVGTFDLGQREAGPQSAQLQLGAMPAGNYRYELCSGGARSGGAITLVR